MPDPLDPAGLPRPPTKERDEASPRPPDESLPELETRPRDAIEAACEVRPDVPVRAGATWRVGVPSLPLRAELRSTFAVVLECSGLDFDWFARSPSERLVEKPLDSALAGLAATDLFVDWRGGEELDLVSRGAAAHRFDSDEEARGADGRTVLLRATLERAIELLDPTRELVRTPRARSTVARELRTDDVGPAKPSPLRRGREAT